MFCWGLLGPLGASLAPLWHPLVPSCGNKWDWRHAWDDVRIPQPQSILALRAINAKEKGNDLPCYSFFHIDDCPFEPSTSDLAYQAAMATRFEHVIELLRATAGVKRLTQEATAGTKAHMQPKGAAVGAAAEHPSG